MDTILYNGKEYTRIGSKWTIKSIAVSETLQKELNKIYESGLDLDLLSVNVLRENGTKFEGCGDYIRAIRFFEKAVQKYPKDDGVKYVLPSLSSCYRRVDHPEKSIELYNRFSAQTWCISASFLTSVAAAYLDKNSTSIAREIANRAYAMSNGHPDDELHKVYQRLKSMA